MAGVTKVGGKRWSEGMDRLSDYARAPEAFRYVETAGGTVIVNADHIVAFRETT